MRPAVLLLGILALACAAPQGPTTIDLTIVNDYAESAFTVEIDGAEVVSNERVDGWDATTWTDVAEVGERVEVAVHTLSASREIDLGSEVLDVEGSELVICYRLDPATLAFSAVLGWSVGVCP